MNDYSGSKSKFGVIIVILLIIILAGVGYYFYKTKNVVPVNNTNDGNNVKKIEFLKKVSGTSGDLYLDNDGKAYFVLSNILSMDDIASLSQEFTVEKNNVYNLDTVKAILLVLPNVIEIGYDNETSNFTLKTKNDVIYNISDDSIRTKSIIYLEEVKENLPEGTGSQGEGNTQGSGISNIPSASPSSGTTDHIGSGIFTPATPTPGPTGGGSSGSSKTGECTCSDNSKGQMINGVCNKISVSCNGSGAAQRCTPSFSKCQ